jgi:hypothetical protein
MICQLTGHPHRLFWMRSAWWCADCRQKIESCCEGGGCPSVAEVQPAADEDHGSGHSTSSSSPGLPALN